MKNTTYTFGDWKCTAYMKQYGQGFEVGFTFGKQQIFVGNFIHKAEATKWWTVMTKEIKTFTTRYHVGETVSQTWFAKFFSTSLYRTYYTFLDTQFAKYNKTFAKTFATEERKYKHLKKNWTHTTPLAFKRVG